MQPHTHPKRTVKSVELDSSSQLENDDELSIELRSYKARVKCVSRAFTSTAPGIPSAFRCCIWGPTVHCTHPNIPVNGSVCSPIACVVAWPPSPHPCGRCIVEEWMAHYRRFLGISPRTPSPLATSRTSFAFSGPPSRLQSSRAQSRPHSHTRHKTHPLPGSRPASQLSALSQSPPCSPGPDLGTSNVGLVYDRPSGKVKYANYCHSCV